MLGRAISFITDQRLPIYYPFNALNWSTNEDYLRLYSVKDKIDVDFIFTMDIEHDYGSCGAGTTKCVQPFIDKIKPFISRHGILPTFFVQGNLIEQYGNELGRIGEVGLHGYAHEPWGTAWFVKDKLPSLQERKSLLDTSLAIFEKVNLPKPTLFRAPNMVIDKGSKKLLKDAGFTTDSSYPSFKGGDFHAKYGAGLLEVPVSCDLKPHFGRFLVARYAVFNTSNIVTGEFSGGFTEAVMRVVSMQKTQSIKPFIVFMCHPWEFFTTEIGDPNFRYCNPANLDVIGDALQKLKERLNLRFVSMGEFAEQRAQAGLQNP
jgi:peptidoglycan/xylan/chitin deacetylase (PgdA/CDA1 family)